MGSAADIAVSTVARTQSRVEEARFVLFSDEAFGEFERALSELQ
jgi:hypothetical protein